MKKFSGDKKSLDSKKYYYNFNAEIYEKKKVFFSTFKNELKVPVNPGNLIFILYVVEDLLFDKEKHEYNKEEETEESKSEDMTEDSKEAVPDYFIEENNKEDYDIEVKNLKL